MDINTFPKMLCDKMHLNFNKAFFFFAYSSGTTNMSYAIAPQSAKGFIQGLSEKVAEYEKMYGTIDMTGFQSGIESPIQLKG